MNIAEKPRPSIDGCRGQGSICKDEWGRQAKRVCGWVSSSDVMTKKRGRKERVVKSVHLEKWSRENYSRRERAVLRLTLDDLLARDRCTVDGAARKDAEVEAAGVAGVALLVHLALLLVVELLLLCLS
jgi:hypothetical protein